MDYSQYLKEMNSINENLLIKARKIKLLILDVDGVMTDGKIIISEDGKESKSFYAQDGHGLVILRSMGIDLAIISGRYSKAVEFRGKELGFKKIIQKSRDKLGDFNKNFSGEYDLENVCFVGDDIVDLELLKKVGLAITVPNANYSELRAYSNWITPRSGGLGAVRDVCDLIYQSKKNELI